MKRTKFAVGTDVPVNKTRSEIEQVLTKFGASSFAFAVHEQGATILFEFASRRIRFDLPLPKASDEAKMARMHRERWRALYLSIKAKLVSVDTEIETFEAAFLAHIVLANGEKVGDAIRPAILEQYQTGKMTPLLGYSPNRGAA